MTLHDLVLQHDFDRAHRSALVSDLVAVVSRRPNRLLSWRETHRAGATTTVGTTGVRSVAIDRIVGSVDRVGDFDRAFRPRRAHSSGRWQRIAKAHHDGRDLPAVRLREVAGSYYVEDGHHRVSVARIYGQRFIDAEVSAVTTADAVASDIPAPSGTMRLLSRWTDALAATWPGLSAGVSFPRFPAIHATHSPKGPTTCTPTPSTCG